MILIKLGGSVITDKSRPLSFRRDAVEALAGAIAGMAEPVIMVHGGGSFGHHYSVIHDMHTAPDTYDVSGLAVVKNSMVQLNAMVLDALAAGGVSPYCYPPSVFMRGESVSCTAVGRMVHMAGGGLCPVSYGDALWCGSRAGRPLSYILSGDRIMGMLSVILRPRLVVFAMDVDGLYTSPDSGSLIRTYAPDSFTTGVSGPDVTGGMARKVREAVGISGTGLDVLFVNGNRPERIADAVAGGPYHGTLFGGAP